MDKQPNTNIIVIGSVNDGKSTLVNALTGIRTAKHAKEIKNNMTIYLGYANCKIWRCGNCSEPGSYKSTSGRTTKPPKCDICSDNKNVQLVKHISFVDCPGHNDLMTTMLNGTAVMDNVILLVSVNGGIQAQTIEHLNVVKLMGYKDILTVHNKIDLISEEEQIEKNKSLANFLSENNCNNSTIIPCSAQHKININAIAQYIANNMDEPGRDDNKTFIMSVIRSFDVNRSGKEINDIIGGVIGGSILQGKLTIGQKIELRPGLISKKEDGTYKCYPLKTIVISLKSDTTTLDTAYPGGLIGVGTTLDPFLSKDNRLVGQLVGIPEDMPDIFIDAILLVRLIDKDISIKKNDRYAFTIGSSSIMGLFKKVIKKSNNIYRCKISLDKPTCTFSKRVPISTKIHGIIKLIGVGKISSKLKSDKLIY